MARDSALNTWRSIRTTFLLFLVVVPIVLVTNRPAPAAGNENWGDLAASAAGMIVIAALVAEALRLGINYLAGEKVCHWMKNT